MAKITPPQEIPSELLFGYQGALGEVRPDNGVRKRYPFRVPTSQTDVGHPTAAQIEQRQRFLDAVDKFNALSQADRQRWYATMPEWGSLLWYYNWFMLNAIPNLWGVVPGGAAILKSIKNYPFTLLAGAPANVNVVITAVDPDKVVIMPYGSGYGEDSGEDPVVHWAWAVYPHIVSVAAELIVMKASGTIQANAFCSITVIEYI